MPDRTFVSLEQAIEAAGSGDTIVLETDGPLSASRLVLHDKVLTIKAGLGFKPRIVRGDDGKGRTPGAILSTDRSLTLEGLTLVQHEKPLGVFGAMPLV